MLDPAVAASNALTARWAEMAGVQGREFVISGAAVWPLLAALAGGAEGRAREELECAIGVPAEGALAAMTDLLVAIDRAEGARGAIGLWVREDVPLRDAWRAALRAGTCETLGDNTERDQAKLDAWVRKGTRGVLTRMPAPLGPSTLLMLIACMAIRTRWSTPFEIFDFPGSFVSGPWKHRLVVALYASFLDLDLATVFDTAIGSVTTFNSKGADSVDVHLLLGSEDAAAGDVLREGILALTGDAPGRSGYDLKVGDKAPGLSVEEIHSHTPAPPPTLSVATVAFDIMARHDLLAHGDLFGLTTASDAHLGHFPGISDSDLAIGHANQDTRAVFSAKGFEAAAVTTIGMVPGAARGRRPRYTSRRIDLAFDRPFGFVAIDRMSSLVLMAGWVDEPTPHPDAAQYEVTSEEGRLTYKFLGA